MLQASRCPKIPELQRAAGATRAGVLRELVPGAHDLRGVRHPLL
jgi:hypothetical protein